MDVKFGGNVIQPSTGVEAPYTFLVLEVTNVDSGGVDAVQGDKEHSWYSTYLPYHRIPTAEFPDKQFPSNLTHSSRLNPLRHGKYL